MLVIAAFAILALSAFGFAATNNVDPSNAGDGEGAVSGFNVTNIDYELGSNGRIVSVDFDLSPTPADGGVQVAFLDGSSSPVAGGGTGAWTCTLSGASANCTTGGAGAVVAPFENLRVIAVD